MMALNLLAVMVGVLWIAHGWHRYYREAYGDEYARRRAALLLQQLAEAETIAIQQRHRAALPRPVLRKDGTRGNRRSQPQPDQHHDRRTGK